MDAPVTKQALLKRLANEKARVDMVLAKFSDAQCLQARTIGDWSIKDLLAHFMAHEQRALAELRCAVGGEAPNLPLNDNDAFNQGAVFASRSLGWGQMKQAWDNSFNAIVQIVQSLPDSAFEPASPITVLLDDTVDGALANNSYEHYADHRAALEALAAELTP
jgi:hypothetical protein